MDALHDAWEHMKETIARDMRSARRLVGAAGRRVLELIDWLKVALSRLADQRPVVRVGNQFLLVEPSKPL